MKPLSARTKQFLYEQCAFGPLRWIARPAYDAILGTELAFHRLVDGFHPPRTTDTARLTAIIKTFERPRSVRRLVSSIRRRYPELRIIVIDDSREPKPVPDVDFVELPYNSGLSVGRNHALDMTETPYFLLLDDDFVFSHRQDLGALIDYMERNPEVDIRGGRCIDLPFYIVHDFHDMPLFGGAAEPKVPIGTEIDGLSVVNKVQNFFIGRTETVRKVKWKPELKVREHTEFFTRARGQLVTVFDPEMKVLHAKTPFDIAYLAIRYGTR